VLLWIHRAGGSGQSQYLVLEREGRQ
jgi:hypothetical protein